MIAHLSGKLSFKSLDSITLSVGGVGYEVHVPLSTFYSIPEEGSDLELLIYTHVKEDVLKLFGFLTLREKELFIKLLGVSGVGPKLALNILSGIDSANLIRAIKTGDIPKMTSIPGVGKKTAERLILELRDKLKYDDAGEADAIASLAGKGSDVFEDALSALINLGYKQVELERTFNILKHKDSDQDWNVEGLIKEALKVISK